MKHHGGAGELAVRQNEKPMRRKMWIYLIIGYCVIGLIIGIKHLSSGKVGAAGPLVTFIASIFLWPLFLVFRFIKRVTN